LQEIQGDFLSLALLLLRGEEEEVQALEQILEQNQEALEVVQVLVDLLLVLGFLYRETTEARTTE
jgi:predicted negative regulator of RcsB-dependent stress response